jgi:heptosyltransferase-2
MIEGVRTLEAAGMAPVLLGAPRDAPLAVTIGAAVDVATLVGRDEPALLPALLSELDVVVAGDTGISHLASALGTPVIALFGPTDPALSAPRGPASVLVHPVPCAPCFYRACPIEHPCLDGITAKQVVDAVCAAHVGERQIAHVGERRIGGGADGGFGGRPEPPNFK